jgi:isopenicillin N synthase-like dioxygenase
MRDVLPEYFAATHQVGWGLMRAFAIGLGVDPSTFVRSISHPTSRGSLVWYPPQPAEQTPEAGTEQYGVSPHTDWGCLTLLSQDNAGGLEVQGRDGAWVTAHPIEGTYVVNVGDLLARWTNDRFKSTPHRVVNRSGRERLSCAMFIDPDRDTLVAPVVPDGEAARYAPVTCGDYVQSRFDAAFAYRKKQAS